MINKMDERQKWKNESNEEGNIRYSELNNELRREAAKSKIHGGAENIRS